jgi:hypothetical protein
MARACIHTKGMPGKQHRCSPIHVPTNFHGGSSSPFIRKTYEVKNQNEPTVAHPVPQHKQWRGHETRIGKIKKAK